ncbi:glycosyl transferase family protein [Mycobacterium tuberculosis]|nr:glycosyl transferase family protein [Mycobacterium tuberculosis]
MAGDAVTVVLPCLNEEESLPAVLAAIPAGYRALVVDNNSTDDTATVAARHGAQVVVEPRPGYGSAVHAGVLAATTPIVASSTPTARWMPATCPSWSPNSTRAPTW